MFRRKNKTQQAEEATVQPGIRAAAVERICKAYKDITAEEEQKRREIQEMKSACIKRIEQECEVKAAEIDEIFAEEEQKRREIQETKRTCIKRIEQEREAKAAEIDEIFERKRKQDEQDFAELEKQIKAEMQ